MRVLITGFNAFGDFKNNVSEQFINTLIKSEYSFDQVQLQYKILDTSYSTVDLVVEKVMRNPPDLIISFGQGKKKCICLEESAQNLDDSKRADNQAQVLQNKLIDLNGDAYLKTAWDVGVLEKRFNVQGIQAQKSSDAGNYVCNHLYYKWLSVAQEKAVSCTALFVHLPDTFAVETLRCSEICSLLIEHGRVQFY